MNRMRQLEELDSIRSILLREEFQILNENGISELLQAVFWAYVQLPEHYAIEHVVSGNVAQIAHVDIKHLPPIRLTVTLPNNYPATVPPQFLISCDWLSTVDITKLCEKLDDIWNEYGCGEVIYSWCYFLKTETLSFLGYDEVLDFTELNSEYAVFCEMTKREMEEEKKEEEEAVNERTSEVRASYYPQCLRRLSLDSSKTDSRIETYFSTSVNPLKYCEIYARDRTYVEFSRSFFLCNICLAEKQGKYCFNFNTCGHVFCRDCLSEYFTGRINDGTVQDIQCPEDKCGTEVQPQQIKEIVSEELFDRYDSLLLKRALDAFGDIVYCPRPACQYPVSRDQGENMAICANCKYVFCTLCRMGYHGIEPCRVKSGELKRLMADYENATEEEKRKLEARYGKQRLADLLNNTKAEEWIHENSKPCPKCNIAIEKSYGCNKMQCWRCNTPFCWLCGAELDPTKPYNHYVDPNSPCAEKLFYLVYNLDDDDDDEEWDWLEEDD